MKRVLLYGNQKCFSKYLKWRFQNILLFDVSKNFKFLIQDLNTYSTIVLVMYTEEDLAFFFKIFNIGVPVIVCSFNRRITSILNDIGGVSLLDTSKTRSEMLKELDFYFDNSVLVKN